MFKNIKEIIKAFKSKTDSMKVTCDYDEFSDVLYLTFDKVEPAICYEKKISVLVRYSPITDRVSGITILNLKDINPFK